MKRIQGLFYDKIRAITKEFLTVILQQTILYTDHSRRKTVSARDVVYALKRNGRTLYGIA